jgi:hypothetical protein
LQEGRENANIDAGWRFIWRISVKIEKAIATTTIGRTAAQASVSGHIKTGMGPIMKLYWRRLNTQFTTGVSR